ncbi:MAG TPA: hypothetical protein PKC80_11865 [Burkholderiaceae bacterium]|nr:hypothetical protein [Burkholderiaceae bacterium]
MTNQAINSTPGKAQLDDFFTTTIVGLSQEVVLGQRFKERALINQQYVTVDAMNAKAWLSEPAYQVLNQALKHSQRSTGVAFKNGLLQHLGNRGKGAAVMFVLGFLTCMVCVAILFIVWYQFGLWLPVFH